MIIDGKTLNRFRRLSDSFLTYANDRLQTSDRLHDYLGDIDPDEAYEVAEAVWSNRRNLHLVSDFVHDNPDKLSRHDLAEAGRWEHGLYGTFTALRDGRDIYFLYDDYAFVVRGLMREIDDVLELRLPAVVVATILPFESVIVYAYAMDVQNRNEDRRTTRELREALADCKANRHVIRSARDFERRAPEVKEAHLSAQAERFTRDFDLDFSEDGGATPTHRGVLAGLRGKDRSATRDQLRQRRDIEEHRLYDLHFDQAQNKTPYASIVEEYRNETTAELRRLANKMRVPGDVSSMGRDRLMRAVVTAATLKAQDLLWYLRGRGMRSLTFARELQAAGGRFVITPDDPDIAPTAPPVFDYYVVDDELLALMPTEYVEALSDVDWDEQVVLTERLALCSRFLTAATSLRGVDTVANIAREYREYVGDDNMCDIYDLYGLFACDEEAGITSFQPYRLHGVDYLTDIWVFDIPSEGHKMTDDDRVQKILDLQEDKPIRLVTEDMLSCDDFLDWEMEIPEVQDLLGFLDENVPDDGEDLSFAEEVVIDVLCDATNLTRHVDYEETLTLNGLVPTDEQLERFRELVNRVVYATPSWANRGWSPKEMNHLAKTGEWTSPQHPPIH